MKKISLYNIASVITGSFLFILGIVMFSLSCNFADYGEGSFNIKFDKEYLFIMISGIISLGLAIYSLIKKIKEDKLDMHTIGYSIGIPSLIMLFYYIGKTIDLCMTNGDFTSSIIKMMLCLVILIWGISILFQNKRIEN